jgi:hypothetical protein
VVGECLRHQHLPRSAERPRQDTVQGRGVRTLRERLHGRGKPELAIRNALAKRGHAPEEIDELTEEWLEAYPKAIEELDKELEAERRNRGSIPK